MVATVKGLRVGRLQSMEDPRERDLAGLKRQMDMIRHQAVGDQAEFEPLAVMAESPQVKLSVRVVAKDRLAFVPADDTWYRAPGNSTRGGLAMVLASDLRY